jgi:hypothetical protein
VAAKTAKIQALSLEDVWADEGAAQLVDPASWQPTWTPLVQGLATSWLQTLPADIPVLVRTAALVKDPLFRCLDREVAQAAALLATVRSDLDAAAAVCAGTRKPTNAVRGVMGDLARGTVPSAWLQYSVPKGLALAAWLADFGERARQWRRIATHPDSAGLRALDIWLGGLFSSEAYITATRQAAAHASGASLEELALQVVLDTHESPTPAPGASNAFTVTGLTLAGAKVTAGNRLELTEVRSLGCCAYIAAELTTPCDIDVVLCIAAELTTPCDIDVLLCLQGGAPTQLSRTLLQWARAAEPVDGAITLPAYRHGNRQQVLFTVDLAGTGLDPATAALRAVAIICSPLA